MKTSADNVSSALETLEISDKSLLSVRDLSQGQQRKIALARLLLGSSDLWILDEPFTSLDLASRTLMENLMQQHLNQKGSILLTTHHSLVNIHPDSINIIELDRE